MNALRTAAAVIAAGLWAGATPAQPFEPPTTPPPDFAKTAIRTTDLGHGTYMLRGEGGNITVAVGDDAVIMVDDEYAPLHDKIKAAIAAVTDKPIRYLVLTHFHRDHTGGNAGFAKDGAIIVAQGTVRTHLAVGTHSGITGTRVPPAPSIALPKVTYTDSLTLSVKGVIAQLTHIPDAHTDGDTVVYFPGANVLATGDVVTFARYPNIDYLFGGSLDGMIKGVDQVLAMARDDTKIVPGHGPLGTKAMIRAYRAMLLDVRGRLEKMIAAGMSEDAVVAAKPDADYDAKLRVSAQAAGNFLRAAYRSMKK
jgi:glyoxylase-like metal-dependent hydrolase (beta-lactamase superfamily II)